MFLITFQSAFIMGHRESPLSISFHGSVILLDQVHFTFSLTQKKILKKKQLPLSLSPLSASTSHFPKIPGTLIPRTLFLLFQERDNVRRQQKSCWRGQEVTSSLTWSLFISGVNCIFIFFQFLKQHVPPFLLHRKEDFTSLTKSFPVNFLFFRYQRILSAVRPIHSTPCFGPFFNVVCSTDPWMIPHDL